jgi:hypothetical protein
MLRLINQMFSELIMPQKIKPILYLSFDIETDGDNPMLNSMISIGFYGITDNLSCALEYTANIESLEGHVQDPKCMEFWAQNQTAWNATQTNKKFYADVMLELSDRFTELNKTYNLKFIAMPSCFDWMFFKSYYQMAQNYLSTNLYDISFKCICISSYFDSYCESRNIRGSEKEALKLQLMEYNKDVDHFALEDAKCQGKLYVKVKQLILNSSILD